MLVYDLSTLGTNKVSFYLALEQYLLSQLDEDIFFLWDISTSIVIGRNQVLEAEVNLEYVKQKNIPIYRRPSGGGAVYADDGCFMYSFITKERSRDKVYNSFLTKIKKLLSSLELDIVFSGRNDLLFKGKKFSGTAIFQNQYGTILHGTFLYDTNISNLVMSLTVDKSKLISKGIKSVQERVINLSPYVNMSKQTLMEYFVNNMQARIVNLPTEAYNYSLKEEKLYDSYTWLYEKNPKYTKLHKKRFLFGSMELYVLIKQAKIENLSIKGDFFTKQNIENFTSLFISIEFSKRSLTDVLEKHNISDYIYDATNKDFIDLLFEEEV